jgi:N-acetylglutamate synthase-like GNAT family acetyltransferase
MKGARKGRSARGTPSHIGKARRSDCRAIRHIYRESNNPRAHSIRIRDYFVVRAVHGIVGCAAVREIGDGGYLYGLTVCKEWRRRGIGSALVRERLKWLSRNGANFAVLLTMFWNVRFFRQSGFRTVPRKGLPAMCARLADFRSPRNRHCAVMILYL